jgi:hypothetical protein
VIQIYDATTVRKDEINKVVYVLGTAGSKTFFKYDIQCFSKLQVHLDSVHFFFNLTNKVNKCLIVLSGPDPFDTSIRRYRCGETTFWLDNDIPVLADRWLTLQSLYMDKITDDFKFQYAALLLDGIIQS